MKARGLRLVKVVCLVAAVAWLGGAALGAGMATPPQDPAAQAASAHTGGEANLILPDLSLVSFHGIDGHTLLLGGLVVCVLGLLFGLSIYTS